jgi:hypothetical protein
MEQDNFKTRDEVRPRLGARGRAAVRKEQALMRKQWLIYAVLLVGCAGFVPAQDRGDIFGGYSYVRTEGDANLHGWIGEVTVSLSPKLDFVADFSGHYTSIEVEGVAEADGDLHNFLFGLRYAGTRDRSIRPFVHGLIGFSRASGSVDVLGVNVSVSDNALGVVLGGGFEVPFRDRLAVRAIQADYLLFRSEGVTANNARLSAGLVVRF